MDVPEVVLNLGHHLYRADLPACLRVCKMWHIWLTPFLYHTIDEWRKHQPTAQALERHGSHVRQLTVCHQLQPYQDLSVQHLTLDRCPDNNLLFLSKGLLTPNLVSLKIWMSLASTWDKDFSCGEGGWKRLEGCTALQELSLKDV